MGSQLGEGEGTCRGWEAEQGSRGKSSTHLLWVWDSRSSSKQTAVWWSGWSTALKGNSPSSTARLLAIKNLPPPERACMIYLCVQVCMYLHGISYTYLCAYVGGWNKLELVSIMSRESSGESYPCADTRQGDKQKTKPAPSQQHQQQDKSQWAQSTVRKSFPYLLSMMTHGHALPKRLCSLHPRDAHTLTK